MEAVKKASKGSSELGIIGVDIDEFISKFSDKWTDRFNNVLSKALIETWSSNAKTLNQVIEDNIKGITKKYIVSAVTGAAKTENIITYSSMLKPTIKVLICTNLTDEADRIAKDINAEAMENIATSYHSNQKLVTLDNASKYQVVIVSHEFYRRNYIGTDKWHTITDDRNLIIIDESLDTIVELSVSEDEVKRIVTVVDKIASFKRYKNNKPFHTSCNLLRSEIKAFDEYTDIVGSGTKLLNSEQVASQSYEDATGFNTMHSQESINNMALSKFDSIIHVLNTDSDIRYNEILTAKNDVSSDNKIKRTMIEKLEILQGLYHNQVYMTSNSGTRSLHMIKDSTPNKSIVCFDATSNVSETYKLRAKHHKDLLLIPKVENVRDYGNVTIYTAKIRTGKDNFNSITKAKDILDSIDFGDKTLVVTHKVNKAFFTTVAKDLYPDKHITVANWGALTGLNNWQDYDTCVCVGLLHKPKSFAQNRAINNTTETVAFGTEQQVINERIEITTLLSEIIQAINRIRVRKTIDNTGNCKTANIYITLPLHHNDYYLKVIGTEMINAKFNNWHTANSIDISEASIGFLPSIIEYLEGNLNIDDEVSIYEPRDRLNILINSYGKIISKSDFNKRLEDFGFEIISKIELDKRGRKKKKPTRYIRRII